jgi:hypothetical protein
MILKMKSNKNIHDIKEPNNNVKTKLGLEQIKVEYFLCTTITKTYVIEITKHLEIMEINKK